MTQHWLFKTEPDAYSIDDLKREKRGSWDGIRNYQARNRLRDDMKIGDLVLIYHSSCAVPAVVGLAKVVSAAKVDPSQFQPSSPFFDAKATADKPRWVMLDIAWQETFAKPLTLKVIKQDPFFADMELVSRGRLSIQYVAAECFNEILRRCR